MTAVFAIAEAQDRVGGVVEALAGAAVFTGASGAQHDAYPLLSAGLGDGLQHLFCAPVVEVLSKGYVRGDGVWRRLGIGVRLRPPFQEELFSCHR